MAPGQKNASEFRLWLEEAWEGWIRPLGLIFLLAIGYVLYSNNLVGEKLAGLVLVLAVVLGSIGAGAWPVWSLVRLPWQRALLAASVVAALGATVYPSLRAAIPGRTLAEGTLTSAAPTLKLTVAKGGPYDLVVAGRFKEAGRSDAEASYAIKASDGAGHSDEVSGTVSRKNVVIRSRKGSSSSVQEHTESTHRLPHVTGAEVTLTTDGVDESLDEGLVLSLQPGSPDPLVFIVLGALALLMALVLDVRLPEAKSKQKTYLTASIAIAFAFSIRYAMVATPHALVRPALDAFLVALGLGGLGGWSIAGIGRALFGPKLKKAPARR